LGRALGPAALLRGAPDAGQTAHDGGGLILTLIGFAALTAGGWLGGAITYVHGMRLLNLVEEPATRAAAPVPHEEKVEAEKS